MQTCTFGEVATRTSKCRGRQDVACASLTSGAGTTVYACMPMCSTDAECPTGRFCDPGFGTCAATKATGDPMGASCTQAVDGDESQVWLIVGGEDHKTGHHDDADARFARLEAWAKERFPVQSFELRWSGQVMEPVDYMGFIGRDPGFENVYVATGDSGQGMTHGTIAGILISDLILGRPNEWEKLYDPGRKTLSLDTAKQFLEENLDVAVQFKDLLPTGGEVEGAAEIKPGEGAILQVGTAKVAAYRDEQGVLHQKSAYCTHLGCVVRWNGEEKSWDCPCHGSRFSPAGDEVLNGPAISGLKPLDGTGG